MSGTILKVSGPLVIAEGMRDANMFDVVRVSEKFADAMHIDTDEANAISATPNLMGEIIKEL